MNDSPIRTYIRIFLLSIIIALLGLAPNPHTAEGILIDANRSIDSGEWMDASQYLATAGLYFPWRYDLNIRAGHYALEAGDPAAAIQYLERPGTRSHLTYDDKILLGDAYLKNGDSWVAEALWKDLSKKCASSQPHER